MKQNYFALGRAADPAPLPPFFNNGIAVWALAGPL
jgi:hypothetical protein